MTCPTPLRRTPHPASAPETEETDETHHRRSRRAGTVLDPFCGSGTTGMVALKHGRRFVGIDLSAKYLDLALKTRLAQSALVDTEAAVPP